jgi:hypothetical protein
MITYSYLLDILKYTIAGLGVVWIAFYLVRPYLDRSEKLQLADLKKSISSQTLPLRLQAYERIVLFIERINPANMLIRLNDPSYSASDLYAYVVTELRNEYQHNVSQQIYVTSNTWMVVKRLKDDTLSIVNNAVKALPDTATGLELSKTILAHLSRLEDNPYDVGLAIIRNELQELF